MTSTGSPSPKPRAGRNNHRQTKSSSFISTPNQLNTKHNTQHLNLHFHNNHQLPPNFVFNNRSSPRSPAGVMTPPQTPKAQQFPNTDPGKKRKNKKQDRSRLEKTKPKDATARVLAVPIPVEIGSPPLSSDELTSGQIASLKLSSTPPSKAYAGPTFHTSPAPSALPMPKFFSKSVPAGTSLQTMMENDTSDVTGRATAGREQEQSHLEILFRAARQENMGMKRQSSDSTSSSEATLDSSSSTCGLDPESPIHNNRRITRNVSLESGLFSMDEFDGPISPIYKERTTQTRSVTAPSKMQTQGSLGEDERRKIETANALKQFLLAPQSPARKTPVSSPSPVQRAQNRSPRVQNRPPPPMFKAGPPLSPTQNTYQNRRDRSSSGTGYFPLLPYEQRPAPHTTSPVRFVAPPRAPAPHRASFHMAPSQLTGTSQGKFYNNNHNSILTSKFEAAKNMPAKSVTDLENDLRRVLMI